MSTDSRMRNCGSKLKKARLDIRNLFLTMRLAKGWNRETSHCKKFLNTDKTNICQK